MKLKVYILHTQDILNASVEGMLPERPFLRIGTLWAEIGLTDEEAAKYKYPIRPLLTTAQVVV